METKVVAREGKTAIRVSRTRPLDVTVLMGGPSSEREVSLISGRAVAEGLKGLSHRVTCSDITPEDTSALDRKGIDVVFIAMHGKFGESGDVQRLCEERGLRYTGSPPRASEVAMDKVASKVCFRQAGLVTPDWVVIEAAHTPSQRADLLALTPLPVVVKPLDGGSSVDVTIAKDAAARDGAVEGLAAKYGRAMVEVFVAGRELTVGILGERALPVIEVLATREFYDYTAKYADGAGTRYVFDHGIPEAVIAKVQAAALTAHRSLGCRDMSRVDFILDASGEAHVLEINTIPGFTGHSLLPMAAGKAGLSFEKLVARIVDMAMER
jgi:D-alanine-D-alanine ligase